MASQLLGGFSEYSILFSIKLRMNIFRQQFKGIVQPKMYILSLLTLRFFQTCMSSFLLFNTRKYIKKTYWLP